METPSRVQSPRARECARTWGRTFQGAVFALFTLRTVSLLSYLVSLIKVYRPECIHCTFSRHVEHGGVKSSVYLFPVLSVEREHSPGFYTVRLCHVQHHEVLPRLYSSEVASCPSYMFSLSSRIILLMVLKRGGYHLQPINRTAEMHGVCWRFHPLYVGLRKRTR